MNSTAPKPAKQAWGDTNGDGDEMQDDDGVNGVTKADSTKTTAQVVSPAGGSEDAPAPDAENDSDSESDDGKPGCCSRCCGSCCRGVALVFRAIFWLIAYIVGFVFLIALGALHITFRIFHAVFNLLAQLRRADLDMVKEFDYENESDATGTEADEEAADVQAIEDHERFRAEQQQQQQQASGASYRSAPSGNGRGKSEDLPNSASAVVPPPPPPKRNRDEIAAARKERCEHRKDDRRRVRAMLAGGEDPGAADGTNRPVKPPKFVSCGCALQAFVAFVGMLMVSVTFLFYSLSQVTLLGIVALLSVLVPRTTVAGMQMAREFEERNDILCRRPWVPPPPQPERQDAP
jgi:hypothetical protein